MKNAVIKKGNNIAIRSDSIIEARFSLTARQNNILDMLLCEIDNDDKYSYELSVDKYKALYNTDTSNIYRDLKSAVKSFEGQGFYITNKETGEEIYFAWFSKIHYMPKKGKIQVNIDQDLKKLLYEVRKRIYYDIKYTLNFNSSYSQRLYYYLKSFEDTGWRIDAVEELRKKLDCPKSYDNFGTFKQNVLDVSEKEVNSYSDIIFNYETIKKGRKITHLKFHIKNKNKLLNNEVAITTDKILELSYEDIKSILNIDLIELELNSIFNACKKGHDKNNINTSLKEYLIEKKKAADNYCGGKKDVNYVGALIRALENNWQIKNGDINSGWNGYVGERGWSYYEKFIDPKTGGINHNYKFDDEEDSKESAEV